MSYVCNILHRHMTYVFKWFKWRLSNADWNSWPPRVYSACAQQGTPVEGAHWVRRLLRLAPWNVLRNGKVGKTCCAVRQAARRRQHRYVWSVIWIRLTGSVWCVCTGRNMTRTWSSPRSMCPETNGSTACLTLHIFPRHNMHHVYIMSTL